MRTKLLGVVFVFVLAITVTEAAQIVGTLLVLSLAITPAAAARRLSANPLTVTGLSVLFALAAADGGLLLSLQYDTIKASVFITCISFGLYVVARSSAALRPGSRRRSDGAAVRPDATASHPKPVLDRPG